MISNGRWLNPLLLILGVFSLMAACGFGSVGISLTALSNALLGQADVSTHIVLWEIRLPRALAAWLVGLALGGSGAALQGLLRNPLAEPGVLGVSACSILVATFTIYYGLAAEFAWAIPLAAIAGATLATGLIALFAVGERSVISLILIGVGLSSFAGALMALLMNLAPNPFSLFDMVNWTLGSVANRSLDDVLFSLPFLLAGLALLALSAPGLAALGLGEQAANAIGVNLNRQRLLVVLGAGLATGAAVALAGAIGFVGIVAPHLVRPWVQHHPGRALLPAALLGGVLLVWADIAVRLIPSAAELKLGVVAALLGAPAFVWIAAQRRAGT